MDNVMLSPLAKTETNFYNMLQPHLLSLPPMQDPLGSLQDSQKTSPIHCSSIGSSSENPFFSAESSEKNRLNKIHFPVFPLLRSCQAGFHQILVTQPRRIAAISLARRVSCEQMDTKSRVVGRLGEQQKSA